MAYPLLINRRIFPAHRKRNHHASGGIDPVGDRSMRFLADNDRNAGGKTVRRSHSAGFETRPAFFVTGKYSLFGRFDLEELRSRVEQRAGVLQEWRPDQPRKGPTEPCLPSCPTGCRSCADRPLEPEGPDTVTRKFGTGNRAGSGGQNEAKRIAFGELLPRPGAGKIPSPERFERRQPRSSDRRVRTLPASRNCAVRPRSRESPTGRTGRRGLGPHPDHTRGVRACR
jgi:hypothetical protein